MKLKMYVVDFEIPRAAKKRALLIGIPLFALFGLGAVAMAMVPHSFTNGQVLTATDLNDDFNALDTRLTAVETKRPIAKVGTASYSLDATYCGKTPSTSGSFASGLLKGWAAAKDLCQTACGASATAHMCTGGELVRSAQMGIATTPGWFAAETAYGTGQANSFGEFDCEGWTSNAATFVAYANYGPSWSSGPDYPNAQSCTVSSPILCCD